MSGCPLSARQKFVLRWLNSHDTHRAFWDHFGHKITIAGHGCKIVVKAKDWHGLNGLIGGVLTPTKIFSPNEDGLAALASPSTTLKGR